MDELITAAAAAGATIVRSAGAIIIVIATPAETGDDLLDLASAAALAKVSLRTLRDARRAGELTMYGSQRTRTIRRADLLGWIEGRKVRPVEGVDDRDIERRMSRIARAS